MYVYRGSKKKQTKKNPAHDKPLTSHVFQNVVYEIMITVAQSRFTGTGDFSSLYLLAQSEAVHYKSVSRMDTSETLSIFIVHVKIIFKA